MPSAEETQRYCPLCQTTTREQICPTDGVNTLPQRPPTPKADLFPSGHPMAQGRYRIERMLGAGGMGTVYAATQVAMQRTVALKVLSGDLTADNVELRRFYREARLASQLRHPHVVAILDFGIDEASNTPYIAMEYVEGRSLGSILRAEGPLKEVRTARLLEQVARALVAAHGAGLVHRDLKPDNIMVSVLPDGLEHVTVLDFGIAKSLTHEGASSGQLTHSGVVVGTPRYMSPEQVSARPVDGRSDLYSLGVILHEMLAGQPPFLGDQLVALMIAHVSAPRPQYPALVGGAAPRPSMVALHRSLLAIDVDARPRDAQTVAATLRAVAEGVDTEPSRPTAVAFGVATDDDGLADTLRRGVPPSTSALEAVRPPRTHRRELFFASVGVLALMCLAAIGVAQSVDPRFGHAVEPLDAGQAATAPSVTPNPTSPATVATASVTPEAPMLAPALHVDAGPDVTAIDASTLEVEVVIDSDPPRAGVYSGGRFLGPTPQRVQVPANGTLVVLQMKGYDTEQIRLGTSSGPRRFVRLRPSIIQKF